MSIPSSIHFHNMDRSPALEADVKNHVDSLSQYYERITDCHVTIDAPHRHHHKGRRYKVVIRISVPGDTLVVSHEDESSPAHDDCYVAVRDAFCNSLAAIRIPFPIRQFADCLALYRSCIRTCTALPAARALVICLCT